MRLSPGPGAVSFQVRCPGPDLSAVSDLKKSYRAKQPAASESGELAGILPQTSANPTEATRSCSPSPTISLSRSRPELNGLTAGAQAGSLLLVSTLPVTLATILGQMTLRRATGWHKTRTEFWVQILSLLSDYPSEAPFPPPTNRAGWGSQQWLLCRVL